MEDFKKKIISLVELTRLIRTLGIELIVLAATIEILIKLFI